MSMTGVIVEPDLDYLTQYRQWYLVQGKGASILFNGMPCIFLVSPDYARLFSIFIQSWKEISIYRNYQNYLIMS